MRASYGLAIGEVKGALVFAVAWLTQARSAMLRQSWRRVFNKNIVRKLTVKPSNSSLAFTDKVNAAFNVIAVGVMTALICCYGIRNV